MSLNEYKGKVWDWKAKYGVNDKVPNDGSKTIKRSLATERKTLFSTLQRFSLTDMTDDIPEHIRKPDLESETEHDDTEFFYLAELANRLFDITSGIKLERTPLPSSSFSLNPPWFTGKDAVDWICDQLSLTKYRDDSIFLCQKLLDFELILPPKTCKDGTEIFHDAAGSFYIAVLDPEKSTILVSTLSSKSEGSSKSLNNSQKDQADPLSRAEEAIALLAISTETLQKQERAKVLEKETEDALQKLERLKAELKKQEEQLELLRKQQGTQESQKASPTKTTSKEQSVSPIKTSEQAAAQQILSPRAVRSTTVSNGWSSEGVKVTSGGRVKYEWELDVDTDPVVIEKELGRGGFATVHKAKWRGTVVALKKLLIGKKEPSERFVREINIMMKIRHPNVVLFMGASLKVDNTFLIMEYAGKGNLHDVIVKENPPWITRLHFARDIIRGLNYLHLYKPNPILHRDLKSQNILIMDNYTAKICDFGLAKETERLNRNLSVLGSTLKWMPPEMLKEPPDYTLESDIYVLGLILWEIITGEYPFVEYGAMLFLQGMQNDATPLRPVIKEELEWKKLGEGRRAFARLMRECWDQMPPRRPRCDEASVKVEKIVELEEQRMEKEKKRAAGTLTPELDIAIDEDPEDLKEIEAEERLRRSVELSQAGGKKSSEGAIIVKKDSKDDLREPSINEMLEKEVMWNPSKVGRSQKHSAGLLHIAKAAPSRLPLVNHHNHHSPRPGKVNWRNKFSTIINPTDLFRGKKTLKPVGDEDSEETSD